MFLSVHHSSFIPHLQSSFLYPFPLIIKAKTRSIASDSHLNTPFFQTVKLSALRHAQAAIWQGPPVPSNTAVPPLAVGNCLFSCVLVVSILGCFTSFETYINFGIRASSDPCLNPTPPNLIQTHSTKHHPTKHHVSKEVTQDQA